MYALASCEGFGEGGRLNRGAVLGSAGEVLAADVSAHHVGAGNADAAKLMVANDSLHIPRGDIWPEEVHGQEETRKRELWGELQWR